MPEFDKREWIYRRVDVTKNIDGLNIINGNVYAYSALDQFKATDPMDSNIFAVRKTYLKIVDSAFKHLNPEYKNRFYQTTEPYKKNLEIDDQAKQ